MSTDPSTNPKDPSTNPDPVDPDTDPDDLSLEDPPEKPEEWTPPTKEAYEKLERAARRRDNALRKAQEEIATLKNGPAAADPKTGDPAAEDPVAKANARLARESTRTALAGAGITDREVQKEILDALNLAGISVDDDGPDLDAVEDLVETLRKAFGGAGAPKAPRPRTPRVNTKDPGGDGTGEPADPDRARYRRILGRAG